MTSVIAIVARLARRDGESQPNVSFPDSGVTTELAAKPGSPCLFFDRFEADGFLVQLRLDWTDFDEHGHPTLDADFLDPVALEHRSTKGRPHYTSSTGSGERSYEWKFANATRRFTVAITWSPAGFACASSAAFAEARVVRAQPAEDGD